MTPRPPLLDANPSPALDADGIARTFGGEVCRLTIRWEIVDDQITTGQLIAAGKLRLGAFGNRHELVTVADTWQIDPAGQHLVVEALVVAWPPAGWDGTPIEDVDEVPGGAA
jgi:hypothetical protein